MDPPAGADGQSHTADAPSPCPRKQHRHQEQARGPGDHSPVYTLLPPHCSPDPVGTAWCLQGPGRQTSRRSCRNPSTPREGPGGRRVSGSALRRAHAPPHSRELGVHRPPARGRALGLGAQAVWPRAGPPRVEDPLQHRGAGAHLGDWGPGSSAAVGGTGVGAHWTKATWHVPGRS